jgi:hypothetical protein
MFIITVQEFIWVFINNASIYTQGHGFRTELISMLLELKPRFLRFPGMLHQSWLEIRFLDIYDRMMYVHTCWDNWLDSIQLLQEAAL